MIQKAMMIIMEIPMITIVVKLMTIVIAMRIQEMVEMTTTTQVDAIIQCQDGIVVELNA